MGGVGNQETAAGDGSVEIFTDELMIGPLTEEITEENLGEHLDITKRFVDRAVSDGALGIVRSPVQDPKVILDYMVLTHAVDHVFDSV